MRVVFVTAELRLSFRYAELLTTSYSPSDDLSRQFVRFGGCGGTAFPTVLVDASLGYRWDGGWRAQLDVLNLFNARANQIEYFYESQLRNEAAPVADRHIHPVEPLAVRLTLAGPLP
jgi:outer membrane receptor protein involved in Fe transport